MNTIEEILREIEAENLAKSMQNEAPEDHKKPDGDKENNGGVDNLDDLAKSMKVMLEDGTPADVIDGTELLKSFSVQLGNQQSTFESFQSDLTKALGGMMTLVKAQSEELANQGKVIAALHENVGRLSRSGNGAKSVMMAKAESALSNQEILTKAMSAKNSGALTSNEFSLVDASIRHKVPIEPALLERIKSAN